MEPFLKCEAVGEVMEAYNWNSLEIATNMFLLGYIEGKRAERARRKNKPVQ